MENKAINLSQGYPDFEVDPILINSVAKYMKLGFNQYAPMPGVLRLREVYPKKYPKTTISIIMNMRKSQLLLAQHKQFLLLFLL